MQYFFDLRDGGEIVADDEGMELSNLQLAQEEAARSLADMARESLMNFDGNGDHEVALEVRDDAGPVFHAKLRIEFDLLLKQ